VLIPEKHLRRSGILLHPTSLPGRFGIGELGSEAHRFADFLARAGQRIWQVLPLGPTGYGDSPYQCFSAFAGNPLLISLDEVAAEGWLDAADVDPAPAFPADHVDFDAAAAFKLPLLDRAFRTFEGKAAPAAREAFEAYCAANATWLDDYALFMAVREAQGGAAWTAWEEDIRCRRPGAVARYRRERAEAIRARQFGQYLFFTQWQRLKRRCQALDVAIMGDIPIFVAHDSADVWSHPDLFQLEEDGAPSFVAGVPPDYFSATGQLWGNPLYRWDQMARTGYGWWIDRFRAALQIVDLVRLDHFRGFEAYWEVPAGEETAVNGRWVKGPGAALFEALSEAVGDLPIVAENLGVITPEVEELRERFGFPGMAILQFAFGRDPEAAQFQPHNYPRNRVVYTGTHDNDTTMGWWTSSGQADSTRTDDDVREEHERALAYLDAEGREVHWAFIRAALASVADTAIVPLQDVLGLGNEARMNLPGRASGNWRWRFTQGSLTDEIRDRLKRLAELYGRIPVGQAAAGLGPSSA
jgi:4-alpha-glucanotransferase